MGAKPVPSLLIAALAAAAGGCADLNLARFAPPGIIKYENIAGDQPANAQIQSRIADRKAAGASRTPDLSQQPQTIPTGMAKADREALLSDLRDKRDTVSGAVEADREAATQERDNEVTLAGEGAVSFEETAEALSRAVDRDTAAARKERGLPPKPPKEEPEPQE